jgi:hypothetical protein
MGIYRQQYVTIGLAAKQPVSRDLATCDLRVLTVETDRGRTFDVIVVDVASKTSETVAAK